MTKVWMPLLLAVVVALGGYAVVRIRDTLGAHEAATAGAGNGDDTKPFNPKHITYQVTGSGGSVNVDYLDQNGQPHRVDNAPLPWSFTVVTAFGVASSSTASCAMTAVPTNINRSSTAW